MDDAVLSEFFVPESILQPLFIASNSSTIDKALERLIEIARAADGRSNLASRNVITTVFQLCQYLPYPSCSDLLLLSLKLLRNLCAGEIINQNSFIEQNGVRIISNIFSSIRLASDLNCGIIRTGLQVLGNVSLAGEEHQRTVWHQLFPLDFVEIARVRSRETCDLLCMVIYTCCAGTHGLIAELCSEQGLHIMAEIIRTASAVDFAEDWLKLLLSRVCLEESYFSLLFPKLCPVGAFENCNDTIASFNLFAPEQAFLLSILFEILNDRISDITVSKNFASFVIEILRSAVVVVDSVSRGKSSLPTGSTNTDVLGYSLTILRDICASDGLGGFKGEGSVDVVDSLLSSGILELLLNMLHDLEPPAIIRKAMKQGENQEGTHYSRKLCPYKGFRRDLVAVIGNCAYRRKHVQDGIRQMNGILLLMQHCVTDEDNPFLREWGIWAVRNLLEGNEENQHVLGELEMQGSVDVPEITALGLRVEVDPKTQRAKLVNIS